MDKEKSASFEGWCVLEIMGHRRMGGYVVEATIAGAGFLRIDVPGENGETLTTQFYPPSSVYCLTPCSEAAARAVAKANRPEPVERWELPQIEAPREEPVERASEKRSSGYYERGVEYDEDGDELDPKALPF